MVPVFHFAWHWRLQGAHPVPVWHRWFTEIKVLIHHLWGTDSPILDVRRLKFQFHTHLRILLQYHDTFGGWAGCLKCHLYLQNERLQGKLEGFKGQMMILFWRCETSRGMKMSPYNQKVRPEGSCSSELAPFQTTRWLSYLLLTKYQGVFGFRVLFMKNLQCVSTLSHQVNLKNSSWAQCCILELPGDLPMLPHGFWFLAGGLESIVAYEVFTFVTLVKWCNHHLVVGKPGRPLNLKSL